MAFLALEASEMNQAASLSDRHSRELPELLQLRRHLHAHPELSGEEYQPPLWSLVNCVSWVGGSVRSWTHRRAGRSGA